MAIYSVANLTTNTTSANANQEVISGANVGFRCLEVGLALSTASASSFGFGRPSAASVTPTSPVTVVAEDAGNNAAGNTTTALAWGTGPTAPSTYLRRVGLPATIGAGVLWTFPRGVICLKGGSGANGSLVIFNLASNGTINTWVVVDE